jgi:hypothetical protein
MDSECVEMDLSTRQRDGVAHQDNGCKMRVAKSVFSIRSLVDLGDAGETVDNGDDGPKGELLMFRGLRLFCRREMSQRIVATARVSAVTIWYIS